MVKRYDQGKELKKSLKAGQDKSYDEYNWLDLVVQGKLNELKVFELDKYLDRNKLSKRGKKADKITAITVDILRKEKNDDIEEAIEENSITGESDSDEDVVLDDFSDESSIASDASNVEEQNTDPINLQNDSLPLVVKTRYGRHAGHWNLYQLQ